MVEAVKQDFPQREIADASFELQTEIDSGRRLVVGVNAYRDGDDEQTRSCGSTPRSSASRSSASEAVRARRDGARGGGGARAPARGGGARRREPHAARCSTPRGRTAPRARSSLALQDVWGDYTGDAGLLTDASASPGARPDLPAAGSIADVQQERRSPHRSGGLHSS